MGYVCGHFGYILLEYLFDGINLRLNIFSANFLACSFLLGSCLLWISLFRHYSEQKNILAELSFCLFYLSSKVWIENIYFTMMAAKAMFIIFLCPICVYVTTEAISRKNKFYLFAAIAFCVFIISVSQTVITLIFAGLLAVYFLRSEKNLASVREFWMIIAVTVTFILL